MTGNNIQYLPNDFGPPVNSLRTLKMYSAFAENYDLKPYYFSAFKQLNELAVGSPNVAHGKVNMPDGLTILQISTKTFPDLSNLTHLSNSVYVAGLRSFPTDTFRVGIL